MKKPLVKISIHDMSKAGLKAFFRIADLWDLNNEQQMILLGTTRSTFYKWKADQEGRLSKDTLERLSYLLGIYKALQLLLPSEAAADTWIKKKNSAPLFHGESALDRMLKGHVVDLYVVRQFLDAERGGWG